MFRTNLIINLYKDSDFTLVHKTLNNKKFIESLEYLDSIENQMLNIDSEEELVLNDIYIFKQILFFYKALIALWENIYKKKYSDSWGFLQDSLDSLRSINKFSLQNKKNKVFDFFENQLLILEKLYPYIIFASIGWEVGFFECSICKKDIDSLDCLHEISDINHISMVKNPMDKRCTVQFDDNSDHFNVLQYLNQVLVSKQLTPITFHDIDDRPRRTLNKKYQKLERNQKCFCGSDKKFKRCCISKQFIEEKHSINNE